MPGFFAIVLAWAIALGINLVPAFMPPTWSVLAVFRLAFKLPLLPLTIGGAAMSALGRAGLTLLSRHAGKRLPPTQRRRMEELGGFINRHPRWREPLVFLLCLLPFPSNLLFIAAGVGRLPLLPVTLAFFVARVIADTFYVWTAGVVSRDIGGAFVHQLTSWKAITVQVGGVLLLLLLFRLPWERWLGRNHGAAPPERPTTSGHTGRS